MSAKALGAAEDEDVLSQLVREACASPARLAKLFDPMRVLATGHMRTYTESFAPLQAFHNLKHRVLPSIICGNRVWYRSRLHNRATIVQFNHVRYVRPEDLRGTELSVLRLDDALQFSAEERARFLRRTILMVVMVNAEVITVYCDKQGGSDRLSRLQSEVMQELGDGCVELTEEDEKLLREASKVERCITLEVPLFKCPFPLGAEDMNDPLRVPPDDRSAGSFIISNKTTMKMHALRKPLINTPIASVSGKATSKPMLRVRGFMRRDDTYRSTATFTMFTPWDTKAQPVIQVEIAYPRKQVLSLYQFFLLLQVDDVSSILNLMWPRGVPERERFAFLSIELMLLQQWWCNKAANIATREDLFHRLKFEGLEDDPVDSIESLNRYDQMKESTLSEIDPQQGRHPVRRVVLAKALHMGYFAHKTAMTALGLQPLDDRDSPMWQVEELLDHYLGEVVQRALNTHVKPMLRRLVRNQTTTGNVTGGTMLHNRHKQMTGIVFAAVFTGAQQSAAMGADLRLQPGRFAPTDEANTTVHMALVAKAATQRVRALRADAFMRYDPGHTTDSQKLNLVNHRCIASMAWQRGMTRGDVERMVRSLFANQLKSIEPSHDAADEEYTATTRSVDFWVTPQWMRRAIDQVVQRAPKGVYVLANRAVLGWVPMTQHQLLDAALAARARGELPWNIAIIPHALGVDFCCENGTSRRPLFALARWRDLTALLASMRRGAVLDTATPSLVLQEARRIGAIEYLSDREIHERRLAVATSPYDLKAYGRQREALGRPFQYMELHPQLLFSYSLGRVPFPSTVSSPRLVFTSKMISQAAYRASGAAAASQRVRLEHAQCRIVRTLVSQARGPIAMCNNVVVAFLAMDITQDDAIIVKKEFAESGGFAVRQRHVYTATDSARWRRLGRNEWNKISCIHEQRPGDRSQLDADGIIRVGAKVVPDDTILVQRLQLEQPTKKSPPIYRDASIQHRRSGTTAVDWEVVAVDHITDTAVRVTVQHIEKLQVGDKLTTFYGQKATIAALVPHAKLPRFTSGPMKGCTPTVIMHPTCLMRMTVGNALVMMCGVAAAQRAEVMDVTFGEPFDLEGVKRACQDAGLDRFARCTMTHPDSGELLHELRIRPSDQRLCRVPTMVSVGYISMMRLFKHTPSNVGKACGLNVQRSSTTGQPVQRSGSSNFSAPIRLGRMERDALLSEGASGVCQDAVQRSGATTERVCQRCGLVNPCPAYDMVNMTRTHEPRVAKAMQLLFEASEQCRHCGERAVVWAHSNSTLRLMNNLLMGANTRLRYSTAPSDSARVGCMVDAAKQCAAARIAHQHGSAAEAFCTEDSSDKQ